MCHYEEADKYMILFFRPVGGSCFIQSDGTDVFSHCLLDTSEREGARRPENRNSSKWRWEKLRGGGSRQAQMGQLAQALVQPAEGG